MNNHLQPAATNQTNHQNQVMYTMLCCAASALDHLMAMDITVLGMTLQGKPVITVLPCPALALLPHEGGWKRHSFREPLTGELVSQYFIEMYGCIVTWTTYQDHRGAHNHVKH